MDDHHMHMICEMCLFGCCVCFFLLCVTSPLAVDSTYTFFLALRCANDVPSIRPYQTAITHLKYQQTPHGAPRATYVYVGRDARDGS